MAILAVRADEIRAGHILASSLENEVFTVRVVFRTINGTGSPEVVIRGPLGVTLKAHPSKLIRILT